MSVVLPVFNAEKYIITAAESALSQPEVGEVILVEDGSQDDSYDVCKNLEKRYSKVRLLCHKNRRNRGAGESRNVGIRAAEFSYIAFIDADDYYLPNRFSKDLDVLENDSDLDGVYNAIGTKFYDEVGRARYSLKGAGENTLTTLSRHVEPEDLFLSLSPIGQEIGHFHADGLTVKRRVFDVLDGFDPEMELSQDTLLFLQMALKCRLVAGQLDQAVAMRGVHKENRIADEEKLRRFRGLMFRKLYTWMRYENLSTDKIWRVWELYYHHASLAYAGTDLKYLTRHLAAHPEVFFSRAFWRKVLGKFGG